MGAMGGDQMTNYYCVLKPEAVHSGKAAAHRAPGGLSPGRETLITRLSASNRPNSYFGFHFWLSRWRVSV